MFQNIKNNYLFNTHNKFTTGNIKKPETKQAKNVKNTMRSIFDEINRPGQIIKYPTQSNSSASTLLKPVYPNLQFDYKQEKKNNLPKKEQEIEGEFQQFPLTQVPMIEETSKRELKYLQMKQVFGNFQKAIKLSSQNSLYFQQNDNKNIQNQNQNRNNSQSIITDIFQPKSDRGSIYLQTTERKSKSVKLISDKNIESTKQSLFQSPEQSINYQKVKSGLIKNNNKIVKFDEYQKQLGQQMGRKISMLSITEKKNLEVQLLQVRALKLNKKVEEKLLVKILLNSENRQKKGFLDKIKTSNQKAISSKEFLNSQFFIKQQSEEIKKKINDQKSLQGDLKQIGKFISSVDIYQNTNNGCFYQEDLLIRKEMNQILQEMKNLKNTLLDPQEQLDLQLKADILNEINCS